LVKRDDIESGFVIATIDGIAEETAGRL